MFGRNFIRRASGIYAPALIGLAGPWRFLPCEECCEQGCNECANPSVPTERSVTIAGVVNRSCYPSECDAVNHTYVLTWGGACAWGWNGAISCGFGTLVYGVSMGVGVYGGGGYHTTVNLRRSGAGTPFAIWQAVTPTKPDCTASSGALPLVGSTPVEVCDASSATCNLA